MFKTNRSLSEFSTFGIGGPIHYFAEVKSIEEMREGLLFAKNQSLPFLILGKGSNCLFDDRGYNGVVLLNRIDFCEWKDQSVQVGAGYSFSYLGVQSAKLGLSGLEFASGIPASVGGAIFMNAGANGKETCEALVSVQFMDTFGNLKEYTKDDLFFSYRHSSFQTQLGAIISATFRFTPVATSRQKQLEIIDHRMKTQPLKDKSIGCIFRNPEGNSAGHLIQESGLKGLRCGGAKVSEIHANFIVNDQQATSKDILSLMHEVQQRVFLKTGIHLQPEVRVIPYD
ncbi:MAG TPA: UDP-N-acetylmuramate dehydrogenase [Chlamydiales bacterium]|nr:UDP-N-acetylmuramate dehydrogenase [Chlamydiales bacterium]